MYTMKLYICTALCAFTKYAVAWPICDKKATTVAKELMEKVILPFEAPSVAHGQRQGVLQRAVLRALSADGY